MTTLYNCKHDGDQFRMTKFDGDMNVESSYLLTREECECPAGHRPSCRHRQMLPKFLQRNAVDSDYFYDHDRNGWIQSKIELGASEQSEAQRQDEVELTDQVNNTPIPFDRRGF